VVGDTAVSDGALSMQWSPPTGLEVWHASRSSFCCIGVMLPAYSFNMYPVSLCVLIVQMHDMVMHECYMQLSVVLIPLSSRDILLVCFSF